MNLDQSFEIVLEDKLENRWENYKDLLLDADPSKEMIEKYLFQSDMYIMKDKLISDPLKNVIAEAVVSKISDQLVEIKNIAVSKLYQGKGYGKAFIDWICSYYKSNFKIKLIKVGTSEYGQGFYQKCGFKYSHKIENFFIHNYQDPIFENGKQVKHMYYLAKEL